MSRNAADVTLPPLETGDHFTVAEFERRYALHPEIKKAELVEGVVYVPSPVRFEHHGRPHGDLLTWLGVYRAATPGTLTADNATVRFDLENEMQPDALLRLDASLGGSSRVSRDDYLEGAPELIAEVAGSSAAYDLHEKRRVYARTGVQEYLVVQTYEKRVDWLRLRDSGYQALRPDRRGVLVSEVFPGLWLLPSALWSADLQTLLGVLREGLDSEGHEVFVTKLRDAAAQRSER